ncbi:MAG: hypothetical protein CMH57_05945 [Myxococcales bacterium]|nr:hypothetical protein [Myxococcales bacterium]
MAHLAIFATALLITLLIVAAVILIPTLIERLALQAFDASNPPPAPRSDPLARSLHRQRYTPTPSLLRPLNPIFSFSLYPESARRLYDWSRELDDALLSLLCDDPAQEPRVKEMHEHTRWVRGQLTRTLINHGPESLTNPSPELRERLLDVESYLTEAQEPER